jgi:anti-sigma factor RsiW
MICRDVAELLLDFLADELSPTQRRLIEAHLRECPPCAALRQSYEITVKLSRRLPNPPPPPQLIERLTAAVIAWQNGGAQARQQPAHGQ